MISKRNKASLPRWLTGSSSLFAGCRGTMPSIDFKAVRSLVSMTQVLEIIGFIPVESSKLQQRGPCPVHRSSSSASRIFSVNLRKNVFQCFRCGAAGNHLELYAAVTRHAKESAKRPLTCVRSWESSLRDQASHNSSERTEKRNP